MITEYDVSFAVKEFLLSHDYTIITWNPPGSQGTFTIPNPSKDPLYKGQVGSESPDIIAFNNEEIVLVEAKDAINKSFSDITKMERMLEDLQRRALLFNICNFQMQAIQKEVDFSKLRLVKGVAIPYEVDFMKRFSQYKGLRLYAVKILATNWDKDIISSSTDLSAVFSVETADVA